jgi:hypothetical protein
VPHKRATPPSHVAKITVCRRAAADARPVRGLIAIGAGHAGHRQRIWQISRAVRGRRAQAPYNLRYDHQIAAASTRQAPSGSGTQNAPNVASATGDLIFRKLFIPPRPC